MDEPLITRFTGIFVEGKNVMTETDEERHERTQMSSTRLTDELSKAVAKTPNRVSLDQIISRIAHYDYFHPERHPHLTICLITMKNGWIVVGKSAPADPANFDEQVGREFAKEDAVRQIWQLEGYLLREKLSAT